MHKFESLCKGILGVFLVVIWGILGQIFGVIFSTFCTTFVIAFCKISTAFLHHFLAWVGVGFCGAFLVDKIGVDVFASNYCKIWLGLV